MQTRNEPVRAREPFMEMQWKIGNVQIDNPFVLAPMAGVTEKTCHFERSVKSREPD